MTSPTEQRRAFDAAVNRFKAGDHPGARQAFTQITDENPAMTDAWLGRLASGDHTLAALAGAHANARALYRETRRLGLQDGALQATVPAPLYLTIPVFSRGTIDVAYASGLLGAGDYDQVLAVLNDPDFTADTHVALWRQFILASLYHRTQRWPDLCAATEVCPPAAATYVPAELLAATQALRAMALASLGQAQAGLDLMAQVSTQNAYISADLALTKGWCLRELGEDDAASDAFRSATIDGQVIPQARTALNKPSYRIVTTDAETIATRTNRWDPSTETSREARAAAELANQRQSVLKLAQERIDELIGLEDAKEQIAVWRTEIQIDQLLAEQGEPVRSSNENHMVFLGPPGTAKTTFARVVGEVLFGLGKITRPQVKEVTEEDIVVGYVSQTAERMKQVCEEARGGVLFIDEAYRLVPQTKGHSFGVDAINTLLKYMEDYRDELVVIVAGYPAEMREFLKVNPGLAGRFHFTLSFASYTPEQIVAIGHHLANKEGLLVDDTAWELLHTDATQLRSLPFESGTMLDAAGNGRYARKVIVACRRERARRLHRLAPSPESLDQLVRTDPSVLTVGADVMARALSESRPASAT
ncbi:AAA family ATPase [Mycobacterium intracellulare]|uniref:AAA family ATPase n=1 Tax=Mycobacterium intracellulare TaxID=1767 RepID=UPI0006CA8D7A|nr:AAA family ATPase [Mycobacterium intracellulare]KPN46538.1 ATPase [Mycobacterium intracellulare subsp. chimaera]